MREKIVKILHFCKDETDEYKADEIINLYNNAIKHTIVNNNHCSPFCDGWYEYERMIIK